MSGSRTKPELREAARMRALKAGEARAKKARKARREKKEAAARARRDATCRRSARNKETRAPTPASAQAREQERERGQEQTQTREQARAREREQERERVRERGQARGQNFEAFCAAWMSPAEVDVIKNALENCVRGINAELAICEEAAYMKLAMFKDVVVPLLGMTHTVLIMISTPVDSFNFFTKLMDVKNEKTGRPLFLQVRMSLACNRCIAAERAHLCKHRVKFLPPWKSDEKQDYMRMILNDSAETMARENMGVVMDAGASVIEKRYIARWVAKPRYAPSAHFAADVVVMTVDPNGSNAATASEMAIVSTALTWNLRVLLPPVEKVLEEPGEHAVEEERERRAVVVRLAHERLRERRVLPRTEEEEHHGVRPRGVQGLPELALLGVDRNLVRDVAQYHLHRPLDPRPAVRAAHLHQAPQKIPLDPLTQNPRPVLGHQVVGVDAHACGTHEDTYELVRDHIAALRRHPFMRHAWIIYVPERNMAHEGGHIYHAIRDNYRVVPLCEKDPGDPGIWTDRTKKVKYAMSAREHVKNGTVEVLDKLVAANARLPEATRAQTTWDKLIHQLHLYRQVDSESLDPNSVPREGISGVVDKYGKKDASAKDDLAFCFTFNMGVIDNLFDKRYQNLDYSQFGCFE